MFENVRISSNQSKTKIFSMTTLFHHTLAHFKGPSYILKIKKYSHKMIQVLSKQCQKWQKSDFHKQFSISKMVQIFLIDFSLKNIILVIQFLLLTNSIFKQLYFLRFTQLNGRPKIFFCLFRAYRITQLGHCGVY